MNAKLQGFLGFLDLLAEGQRRQAELVTGRSFEFQVVPAALGRGAGSNVVKFPLSAHQKAGLSGKDRVARVTTTR